MRIRIFIISACVCGVSMTHAQPVIPVRPMPMPAVVQHAEADYIYRFSCEDKGTHFICRNMLDPKRDVLRVYLSDPKQRDFYKAIEAKVASGEGYKILMNPTTREMAILKPKFDPREVAVYASDMGELLRNAGDTVGVVQSALRDEPLIAKTLPAVAATVKNMDARITAAVKAADAVVGTPPMRNKEREKAAMLGGLAKLLTDIGAIGPELDRGIAQAKFLMAGLKGLVATGVRDKDELKELESFIKEMELARRVIRQAQIDIQALINLHVD